MDEPLRRLVNIGSFSVLQDKLTQWLHNYRVNSSDQNVTRCCELIELHSKMQSELFRILGHAVSQGGLPAEGANIISARLLPWLSQKDTGLISSSEKDGWLASIKTDDLVTHKEMSRLQQSYDRSLQALENDLRSTRSEADYLQNQMEETRDELNSVKHQTSNEKIAIEMEAKEMHQKMRLLADEFTMIRSRGSSRKVCDSEIRKWEKDMAKRTCRNGHLPERVCLDSSVSGKASRVCLTRQTVPTALHDSCQRLRQDHLIERFLEMYSIDHPTAMNSLRVCIDSKEERQTVLFHVMQEAFAAAKQAFANYEMKVRSTVILEHSGSPSVGEVVQNYISRNPDDYNLTRLVSDVMRAVRQRRPSLAMDTSLSYIESFIREACRLAWNMQALPRPLDVAPATTHEVFDNQRYYYNNSYCTAPHIEQHVWPSLMQGLTIIVKGEAYTTRGEASLTESPDRFSSPVAPLIPLTRMSSPLISPRCSTGNRSRSPSLLKRQQTLSRVFEPCTSMHRIPLY